MKNKLKETRPEWVRKIDGAEYIWSIHVLDEHIVAGSDIGIHIFNVKGNKLWEYKTNKHTYGYIINKHIVAGSDDQHVYYFDIKGNIKWKHKVDGVVRAMDIWSDLIVVCDPSNVYLFNTDGFLMWKRNINEFHKEEVALLSVDINGGYIVVGSCTEWDGFLYLFDLNGNLKWKYDIIPEEPVEGLVNSVYISDGYVCAGSSDCNIYLFDINGNLKWKYDTWWAVNFVGIHNGYVGASNDDGTYLLDIWGNLKWVYNEPSSSGYHYIYSEYVATCSFSGGRVGEICLFDIDGNLKMRHIAMTEDPGRRATIIIDEDGIKDIKESSECAVARVHMSDKYLVAGGDGYIYLFNLKKDMYDLGRLVVKKNSEPPRGHLEIYPHYSE